MGKMIKIFWRDIPSHVIYKNGREKTKRQLDPKFAIAIDRAAMRAGKGSSDAYMSEWRRVIEKMSKFGFIDKFKSKRIFSKIQDVIDFIYEKHWDEIKTKSLEEYNPDKKNNKKSEWDQIIKESLK